MRGRGSREMMLSAPLRRATDFRYKSCSGVGPGETAATGRTGGQKRIVGGLIGTRCEKGWLPKKQEGDENSRETAKSRGAKAG